MFGGGPARAPVARRLLRRRQDLVWGGARRRDAEYVESQMLKASRGRMERDAPLQPIRGLVTFDTKKQGLRMTPNH